MSTTGVPFALELRETVEHVRKAEMNVGRGRIDAELHAERPAELQLAFELSFGQDVHRMARQFGDAHRANLPGNRVRFSISIGSISSAGSKPDT